MRSSSLTLYIDTSSSRLYSGIVKDDKLINKISKELGKELSKLALNEIKKMLDDANIKVDKIDKIIVVNGPGSFTGIRIGITIAKVLAWTLNKEITTISSLEAMGISNDCDSYKVPIIDARRKCVYAAVFDKDNNKIMNEKYISLNELNNYLKEKNIEYNFISNDNFEFEKIAYEPDIEKIVTTFNDKKSVNAHDVNPEYLKHTEAEENKGMIFDD